MRIYQPYTYLIGWSNLNKWYYGVRYSKHASLDELWVKYFTSSKYVKRFSNIHGKPNIIKIRKVFTCKYAAIEWEQKVLRRLNVEKDDRFLNFKNSTTSTVILAPNTTSFKKGSTPWNKGINLKDQIPEDVRKARWGRAKSNDEKRKLSEHGKKRFQSTELREIYRKRTIEQFKNPIHKHNHRIKCNGHGDKIWINDGQKNKRVKKEELASYTSWFLGRIIPREKIELMIKNRTTLKDPLTGRFIKKGEQNYGNNSKS